MCEGTFWQLVESAFHHILLGISLNPKPRRNAPVTSPKIFEQVMANPKRFLVLIKKCPENRKYEI